MFHPLPHLEQSHILRLHPIAATPEVSCIYYRVSCIYYRVYCLSDRVYLPGLLYLLPGLLYLLPGLLYLPDLLDLPDTTGSPVSTTGSPVSTTRETAGEGQAASTVPMQSSGAGSTTKSGILSGKSPGGMLVQLMFSNCKLSARLSESVPPNW